MKIKPLDDRILVKPTEAKERTASGIYLPENAKERPMTGTVVAVGPGKLSDKGSRSTPGVKKGDVVVYGNYAGTEVELDGTTHKIMRESELLGVVQK